MENTSPQRTKAEVDSELLAIRQLIAEEPVAASSPKARQRPDPEVVGNLVDRLGRTEARLSSTEGISASAAGSRTPPRRSVAAIAAKAGRLRGSHDENVAERETVPPSDPAHTRLFDRIRQFSPPKARRVFWAALLFIAIVRPWLTLSIAILAVACLVWTFLTMGPDRFWGGVLRNIERIGRTRPQRAIAIRRKLDAFALRWDVVLDHLPERWVEDLYMPDFAEIDAADAKHETAINTRLDRLREEF